MIVSTKGRYALRVMIDLAEHQSEKYVPLKEVAARQEISEKYLENILKVLVQNGFLEGLRGKGGGYRLSRELKDYSVGEIVRLTEGSLAPVSCLEGENTCPRADKCLSLPVWEKLDTLINDYLDNAMKPFRQLQYDYYRTGLDEMANNADRGRTNISTAIETNLKKAHDDKPLSSLPAIWTDYKKDELANIYKGKGTQKEKENVYEVLFSINASQNSSWEKIKE